MRRSVEGLPFFNRRYTKGVPFLRKTVHKMVNLHPSISRRLNAEDLPTLPTITYFVRALSLSLSLFFSPGGSLRSRRLERVGSAVGSRKTAAREGDSSRVRMLSR